jgi:hypothetical protein
MTTPQTKYSLWNFGMDLELFWTLDSITIQSSGRKKKLRHGFYCLYLSNDNPQF